MKLKNKVKRVIATMLMLALIIGLVPVNNVVLTKAATSSASLSYLGSLGTVEIGDKSESGNWYQIKVGGNAAFCLDLGLACHSGDTYESETDTYSSDSSNKKKSLEAYVGYWYDQTKNQSRKAWVYAQCLMWSIEEGYTSKSELTDVIKQVRSNTGYYDSKTAAELYDEIFEITQLDIVNNYKKVSINVVKNCDYSADGKAHGEATLDGAEYKIYSNSACTQLATVYDANGNTKTAGTYTVKNGTFTTDYLLTGVTYYVKAGDKVATITTGKIVEFTDDCNGICTYNIQDDGSITMCFPLGKYELKEVNTLYSYFLPEIRTWDLEFVWNNQDEEYVFNMTDVTNEEGILSVQNELVKTDVSIFKPDKGTQKPVKDTVFGFYSRDNIYNAQGEVIVKKGEIIATVTTNEEGVATLPFNVPLMSEGYSKDATEEDANAGLNSGNYYWKEESVSESYYLDDQEIDVHLEYVDQDTDVIVSLSELPNTQTETTIGKLTLTGSIELPNCSLKISDATDNDIITWTSGAVDSIWITDKADEFGYRNLTAAIDEKGNLVIKGLFHDKEYKLIETKPCDGYASATDIIFKLVQGEKVDEAGNKEVITTALIKDATGNFIENTENKVLMYDDTTKIEFSKTDITGENEVPGCDMEVTEKDTGVVMDSWTSGTETHIIEGKYVVGKAYVLTEKRPAPGFATADSVEFTVSDTGEIQKVSMKDETIKVEFYKIASDTNKLLGKAKFNVYDSSGKKVYSFTTNSKAAILIEGVFTAGETYRFVEAYTPKGYETAAELEYTVKDTGEIQKIEIIDEKTPDTPKTGIFTNKMPTIIFMGLLLVAIIFNCMVIVSKRKKKANA